jgi:ATP-binding cassette, subfamily B, bacterial PglK
MLELLKRLWCQIKVKRKRQLRIVMAIMLAASVAEVVSIGAIMPFLIALSNPELIFQHELAQNFINYMNITDSSQLLLPFTIMFSVAALAAGLTRIILLWSQARLAHAIGADFGYQIYKKNLYQPYSVHIKQNSSEVIATISTKADHIVGQILLPVLRILSSIVILTVILVILVVINPVVTIGAIIGFVFIYGMLIVITKKKLFVNSNKISQNTNTMIKIVQEGLGGIRDVLIDGTQSTYCKAFRVTDKERRRASANNHIMGQSPRYAIESIGMVLIAMLAFSLSQNETGLIGALPIIGALAIGSQRMLPLFQQAYGAWSNIKGGQGTLRDSLKLIEWSLPKHVGQLANNDISFQKEIHLNNISYRYQENSPLVLSKIDLKIPKGSVVGFVGTTGSGKSTLLDIIMALLHPLKGALEIDGVKIDASNYRGWQSHIAHIPQNIYLSDSTIAENIAFGIPKDKVNYKRVVIAAQKAQIDKLIQSWVDGYDTMVGERGVRLSGGQRQRIGIARALYKHTDVLILDEATSALDKVTERSVMDAINNISKDVTILIVAHRLSTLKNCDLIVELKDGVNKMQDKINKTD